MIFPSAIYACVLVAMGANPSLPAPQLINDTSRCPKWAYASERSCYQLGRVYAPADVSAPILAHEAAHHVQFLQGRVVASINDDARRQLEAEAVRVQIECGDADAKN